MASGQWADESTIDGLKGDDLLEAIETAKVKYDQSKKRAWTTDFLNGKSEKTPSKDCLQRDEMEFSGELLIGLGVWGQEEGEQLRADISTAVNVLWDGYENLIQFAKRDDTPSETSICDAIADNVYNHWDEKLGWPETEDDIFRVALRKLCLYELKQKRSSTKDFRTTDTLAMEHGALQQRVAQKPHLLPERDMPDNVENKIPLEDMSLIVSLNSHWDGNGLGEPNSRRTTSVGMLTKGNTLRLHQKIMSWLRSCQVGHDPAREDIVLLCPNAYNNTIAKNAAWIIDALVEEHRQNATNFKMKIVPRRKDSEETPNQKEFALETSDQELYNFFSRHTYASQATSHFECNPPSSDAWNKAKRYFRLTSSDASFDETYKIMGISQPVNWHQLVLLTQVSGMSERCPASFIPDGLCPGNVTIAWLILWHTYVRNIMAREIEEERGGGGNGIKHLAADAQKGSACPSSARFPFRCLCEPESSFGPVSYTTRPFLVRCPTKALFAEWENTYDLLFDIENEYTPELFILDPLVTQIGLSSTSKKNRLSAELAQVYAFHGQVYLEYCTSDNVNSNAKSLLESIKTSPFRNVGFNAVFLHETLFLDHHNTKELPIFIEEDGEVGHSFQVYGERDKPWNVYILHSLCWSSQEEFTPYLELLRAQLKQKIAYEEIACQQAMRNYIVEEAKDLLAKTGSKKISKAKFIDQIGRRRYPAKLRHFLSSIAVKWYHDTTLHLDNGRNVQIKPLRKPVLSGELLLYKDADLEECNKGFNAIKEALQSSINNTNSPEANNNLSISKTTLISMWETCQVIATLPSMIKLIKDGEFKRWSRERIRLDNEDIASLPREYDFSNEAVANHVFRPGSSLHKKAVQAIDDDLKMTWLMNVIQGITARDTRIMLEFQATKISGSSDVKCEGECQLEKLVVIVQGTFVRLAVTAFLQERCGAANVVDLDSNMNPELQKENVKKFQRRMEFSEHPRDAHSFMTGSDANTGPVHNSEPRILVAVLNAITPSMDLTCANHMILLEPAFFPSEEVRVAKQMHGASQTRRCFLYRPVIKGLKVEEMTSWERKKWLKKLYALPE